METKTTTGSQRAMVYLVGSVALVVLGAVAELVSVAYATADSVLPSLAGVGFALTLILLVAGVSNYRAQDASVRL